MHKKETESEIKTSYFKGVPGCHSEILDWASRESDPKIKQDQREKEGQCLFTFLGHCPLNGPHARETLAFCTGDAAHPSLYWRQQGKSSVPIGSLKLWVYDLSKPFATWFVNQERELATGRSFYIFLGKH